MMRIPLRYVAQQHIDKKNIRKKNIGKKDADEQRVGMRAQPQALDESHRRWSPRAGWLLTIALVYLLGCSSNKSNAATVTVGSKVPLSQRVPMADIEHAAWSKLLAKYVDDRGMVDYSTWHASKQDTAQLDTYLRHLSSASISDRDPQEVKLAFWINAYNAVTVRGILREYPTTSIRNHTAKIFGYNIWKNLLLQVDDRQLSLDAIEHEILRKMGEPRIHFAIVCASISCPKLRNEAYEPDQVSTQLDDNARDFFSDTGKFRFDSESRSVSLSPILDWFGEDFGRDQSARLRAIAPFVPAAAEELLKSGKARVRYLDYDWGLNDQKPKKR